MNDAITAAEGTGKPDASSRSIRSLLAHWGPTIVFNIAGPILLYGYLTDHGWSKAHALMLASLLPLGRSVSSTRSAARSTTSASSH